MRNTPHFLLTEVAEVKRLIQEYPWATFVSATPTGLVASHYPVVLEETDDNTISVVSHFGRPDEEAHELGQHETMVIVQGPHGYISPSWYPEGQFIPTWNHVTAHLWGTPEILSDEDNFEVLDQLVDLFESKMPEPRGLDIDRDAARGVASGTIGLRLRVTRFDARAKLSQNKPADVVANVIDRLEAGQEYHNPALASEMRRVSS